MFQATSSLEPVSGTLKYFKNYVPKNFIMFTTPLNIKISTFREI